MTPFKSLRISYSAVINACSKCSDWWRALSYFDDAWDTMGDSTSKATWWRLWWDLKNNMAMAGKSTIFFIGDTSSNGCFIPLSRWYFGVVKGQAAFSGSRLNICRKKKPTVLFWGLDFECPLDILWDYWKKFQEKCWGTSPAYAQQNLAPLKWAPKKPVISTGPYLHFISMWTKNPLKPIELSAVSRGYIYIYTHISIYNNWWRVVSPFVIASHQLQRSLRYATRMSPSPKKPAEGGRVVSNDCQHQRLWSSSTMAHCLGDLGGEAWGKSVFGVVVGAPGGIETDFTKDKWDKWPIFWNSPCLCFWGSSTLYPTIMESHLLGTHFPLKHKLWEEDHQRNTWWILLCLEKI